MPGLPKPTLPLDRNQPWRIGVYTGGEVIGDGLWKLPFVRVLRTAFPNAHITWMARSHTVYASSLAPVVEGLLDEVLDDSGIARKSSALLKPGLPVEKFDLLLDTQRTVWRAMYMRRLTRGLLIAPAMDYRFSMIKPPTDVVPTRHLGQLFVDWVGWITGEAVTPDRSLAIPSAAQEAAKAALPDDQAVYVGFVPGAGDREKCWPLTSFIAVAKAMMVENPAIKPVFMLGPDEIDWRDDIANAVPEALFPEQAPNQWPEAVPGPLRAMAVGERLKAAVSNDCGTGHMLAAVDCPLLTLFGPTEPAKFKPLNNAATALLQAQDYGAGYAMALIPVEAVTDALRSLLDH